MSQHAGQKRVKATLTDGENVAEGETNFFDRFLHTHHVDVIIAPYDLSGPTDEPIDVSIVAVQRPKDGELSTSTDCATGIDSSEGWHGIRSAVYIDDGTSRPNQVHFEDGMDVSTEGRRGNGLGVAIGDPKTTSAGAYVVSGTVGMRKNEGATTTGYAFLGLEGNVQHSEYGVYNAWQFAMSPRYKGSNLASTIVSTIVFTNHLPTSVKNLKFVSFQKNTNSMVANFGASSVEFMSPGRWRIKWAQPFADANYAVVGIANMWCSGGMSLHIDDTGVQTAGETYVASTDESRAFTDLANDCAFSTVVAIGN
jgi:hypothetical protein